MNLKNSLLLLLINRKIKKYGEILSISMDNKNINFIIQLNIDSASFEQVVIQIFEYNLIQINNVCYIEFKDFSTSKLWMTHMLQDFVKLKKFEISKLLYNAIKIAM
ncbi:MAG: hypothetical protein BWY22_02050 [Bacteroidetes bacterium ADurb.Bin217]|nr:MAG: hypothetical protein BWY22_02050 [Bacteroidetes bacterium ADurb.Bin217]